MCREPIHDFSEPLNPKTVIYFPVEADTEFYHPGGDINNPDPNRPITKTLTCQFRAKAEPTGLIFSHSDSSEIARHPIMERQFGVFDYMAAIGHSVNFHWGEHNYNLPTLEVMIYGFFLTAEIGRIFQGQLLDWVLERLRCKKPRDGIIEMKRRLQARTELLIPGKNGKTDIRGVDWIKPPAIIEVDGQLFDIRFSFIDVCAVLGKSNYDSYYRSLTGEQHPLKNLLTQDDKSQMNVTYVEKPHEFDLYSLGDTYVIPPLEAYEQRTREKFRAFGVEKHFQTPPLTLGSATAKLKEALLLKHCGLDPKDKKELHKYLEEGTAAHFKTHKQYTSVLNGKVDGGRCRNNRPTVVAVNSLIADADIQGCYGKSQKYQDYPIGKPVVIKYPIKSTINEYMTLGKFLRKYGKELEYGLWQARVSTPPNYQLKYPQNFLMSWKPPKDMNKVFTDTDMQEIEWFTEDNVGVCKIFTHQVDNAIVTSDTINLIETVCSPRQRKELLDNLLVKTAAFYPKTEECQSFEEFVNRRATHNGRNQVEVKVKRKKTKITEEFQECHAWLRVNEGDLIINDLLAERKKYSKRIASEKPYNEMYKRDINTTAGNSMSPYFAIGNVVVGNNITNRARMMAWCMEAGLHGFQTITDGCAFEPNRVVYAKSKQKLTTESVYNGYTKESSSSFKINAIGGFKQIEHFINWNGNPLIHTALLGENSTSQLTLYALGEIAKGLKIGLKLIEESETGIKTVGLNNERARQWLETQIKEHLKQQFPRMKVIDLYDIEIKDLFDGGAFHATANYNLWIGDKLEVERMRSYKSRPAKTVQQDEGKLLLSEPKYVASREFLTSLYQHPNSIPPTKVYMEEKILKPGEWKNNWESSWQNSTAFPGCTVESARILRPCNLNQFTFQTFEQWQSWNREQKKLIEDCGHSYEMFFLNPDGTLNFQQMVIELDEAIRNGAKNFKSTLSAEQRNHFNRLKQEHQEHHTLKKTREQLNYQYGRIPNYLEVEPMPVEGSVPGQDNAHSIEPEY
ncbi:hypothetical protein [Moorena sp. SIO3A5]|uniref:hypothetical protein n=1 Tax=Moorena sp. SIO3A5 TaxID=2607822 RepID=UPI00141C5EBA|nr:hypothetical protein [Moorena sp. SIO3A5]NEP70283.1 hypothetical protein [Moorena sp. SIO3A5]